MNLKKLFFLLLITKISLQAEQPPAPAKDAPADKPKAQDEGTDNTAKKPKKTLKKTHENLTCNQELLTTFGLKGSEAPSE